MPKVSVVMPIYNAGRYLRESLDSVVGQTLTDIEIVCVDDGSTDASLDVIREYAARDQRIVVLTGPNAGYGAAMNKGIAAATGDYVGIVEPDDWVDPEMFERLWVPAVEHDCEVVKSDFLPFTGEGDTYRDQWYEICPDKGFYGKVLDPVRSNALFYAMMMSWTGIYRRSFLERHDIRHNETPGAAFQDNGFWIQVFAQARRVWFVNEAHYHYRTDNAASSIRSMDAALRIAHEFAFMRTFLERDPVRWERLKHVFGYYYFDNLLARLSHVEGEAQTEFKRFMATELKRYHEAGEVDFNWFPDYMNGEFFLIMLDPDAYVPSDHVSVEGDAWAEMAARHERTEALRLSNSPWHVVRTYVDAIVD